MRYYILLPGDSEKNTMYDTNVLGEYTFKRFKPDLGYEVLQKIVNERPELIATLEIANERGKRFTVEEFLNEITKK